MTAIDVQIKLVVVVVVVAGAPDGCNLLVVVAGTWCWRWPHLLIASKASPRLELTALMTASVPLGRSHH